MRWNPQLLDKHIAPGISTFSTASIPDISSQYPQAEFWPVNCFLNGVLHVAWPDQYRQIVIGFLRRASQAHENYIEARQITLEYLEGNDTNNPRIGRYFKAIAKWETFAIDFTMTCDLYKWLNNDVGAFKSNDGTKECRLYDIGNKVKHLKSCLKSGQCSVNDTLPLWLNATGLNSFGVTVSFEEAAEVLCDICKLADELQDPHSFFNVTKKAEEDKAVTAFPTNQEGKKLINAGSFAPPLTDVKLSEYEALAQTACQEVRDGMLLCLKSVKKWWNLPESTGSGRPHPSGTGFIIDLDESIQEELKEDILPQHEIEAIQKRFDAIDNNSQHMLRNAAFHLLWHLKELSLNREPMTNDKL